MTYFEIDAQIHGIKQLKQSKKKEWDSRSLEDVILQYSLLKRIVDDIYGNYNKDILNIWLKDLVKRMHRENLLGKNMKLPIDLRRITENWHKI
jgi:hypothetical protein